MIVQSDLLIKAAITHILEEVRKNDWLLNDVFSQLTCDPLLKSIYGDKEIARAKEWLENNKIEVLLKYRNDSTQTPYVSIALGSSSEAKEYATLSDSTTTVESLSPKEINKPIPYIAKPFTISSYIQSTGELKVPDSVDLALISAGMLVVNPDNGNAYEISGKTNDGVLLKGAPVVELTTAGVIPEHREWRARREQAQFQESYSIGCHVHGDPAPLIWLHSILLYGMLRYRETLFEARGLQISSISSSDMVERAHGFENPGGEQIFSRWISLTGLVQNTWIKGTHRVIESLVLGEKTENGYISGVKIIECKEGSSEKKLVWATEERPKTKKKAIFRA